MNYILENISPLEAKTVSDLLQKSSVIGSALQALEKVPHQSLVSEVLIGAGIALVVTSSFYTMILFSQKGYRNNSKGEENGNKQATIVLSNQAIYNFVLTLNNSPQIISTKVDGKKSEIKHM